MCLGRSIGRKLLILPVLCMLNGKINPVSGIFLGKNAWNYADKQEVVLTPNTGLPTDADAATVAAKYEELPDVDE